MADAPRARVMKVSTLEGLIKGHSIPPGSSDLQTIHEICGFREGLVTQEIAVERFREVLLWMAARFYPREPMSKALCSVGSKLFDGYRQTIFGRIQLAAMQMLGADQMAMRVPRLFGSNSNFGERTVEKTGVHSYVVTFRGVPLPGDYYVGIFSAALRTVGITDADLNWTQIDVEDMQFTLNWS